MKIQHLFKIVTGFCLLAMLALLVVLAGTGTAAAQPGLPGPPDQTPIDGGLSILAILGGSYAIHKLRKKANIDQ